MIASSSRLTASTPKRAGTAVAAGSVTDEQFQIAFNATPLPNSNSINDLLAECQKQSAFLENTNNDWSKRVKALQSLRSILLGALDQPDAIAKICTIIGPALQASVKDLRSQVCREACITTAYYSEKLGCHFWRVVELLVPTLMQLSQNSAKVMSTSAIVACRYVAKYVRNTKLALLLMSFSSSKSKDMRRTTASLVSDIINNWETSSLEKCWPSLNSAIKSSLYDADVETRALGRQAFETLQAMYPQRAEFLFQELDPTKQRMLSGRSSTASSTHSINSDRENLQAPNRGLYAATQQNAFLSKRSTSDLNHSIHSIRKMNLGGIQRIQRPPVRSAKPPQAVSTLPKPAQPHDGSTPAQRKVVPNVVTTTRTVPSAASSSSSTSQRATSKSSSQPGSRSTSPNRFRAPRSHIPAAHVTEKRTATNGTAPSTYARNQNAPPTKADITQVLKTVNTQSRNTRQTSLRNFDDGTYALSPSTGFINRQPTAGRFSDSPNGDSVHYANGKPQNNNTSGDKWLYKREMVPKDRQEQLQYVDEICNVLHSSAGNNCDEKEVEAELSSFAHVIRDESLTWWDDYFSSVFLALIQSISHQNNFAVKLNALRALKELCINQPKRVEQKPEMAMINVLNAHNCEDATVVRVAEECGGVLANILPVDVCRKILLTVIDDEKTGYHQLAGAIKMLSRVLEKLSVDEVQQLLPDIVGRMMKCYESSQSMVRRASIICLVTISNSVGIETLKSHLNASTLKLVEVYRDRMTKGK